MRKPISKHALRRALDQVQSEGHLQYNKPVGTIVDQLWHELGKQNYESSRKRSISRDTVRTNQLLEQAGVDLGGPAEP